MSAQEAFETISTRLGRQFFERLSMSADDVFDVPNDYREARIPKRSGGFRQLSIPCPDMLALQRKLMRSVLRYVPDARYAKGFKRSLSIANHAAHHVGRKCIIRFDIRHFFGSIQLEKVRDTFRSLGWSEQVIDSLLYICAHPFKPGLPQGAATSPVMSNIINHKLDLFLADVATAFAGTYTRYADDLTFSFPYRIHRTGRRLEELKARVRSVLAAEDYALNHAKTIVMGDTNRQVVTGLVVNHKAALPRVLRRRLRAAEHRYRQGRQLLCVTGPKASRSMDAEQLRGWIAYRSMIANTEVCVNDEGSTPFGVWHVPQSASGVLKSSTCTDQDLLELPNLLGNQWVELTLSSSAVTDAGLRSLGRLPKLRVLRLDHTTITDDGVAHFADLRNLEELDLSNTGITDAGMVTLGRLPRLTSLSLRDTAITQAGWPLLQSLKQLKHLKVSGCKDGDAAALAARALPGLRRLDLKRTGLTNAGLHALAQYETLEVLDASSNPIGDAGLSYVSTLASLVMLNLAMTEVTDKCLEQLIACKQLRELNVLATAITPLGCGQLEKMLPACVVMHNYIDDHENDLHEDIPF